MLRILLLALLISSVGFVPSHARSIYSGSCAFDDDELALPSCALEIRKGHLYIKRHFARFLFSQRREARQARILSDKGWSWFDRSGRVLATSVAVMDNYANDFHHGLVRLNDQGKWGLGTMHGTLAVPLIYDGMMDYDPANEWQACTGCRQAGDGEHHWFEGGSWVTLDRHGTVVSKPGTTGRRSAPRSAG